MNLVEIAKESVKWNVAGWLAMFGKIRKKSGNVEPAEPNEYQQRISAIVEWCHENGVPCRIIALKPRQKGSTTFSVAVAYRRLMAKIGRGLFAGGSHFQAANMFKMLTTYVEHDEGDRGRCNVKATEAEFFNGSTLERITLRNAQAGRSGTYQVLVITEVAYLSEEGVANADDVVAGLLKCVPDEPDTIVIEESTAHGACYDAVTEVLTDQGWKYFADLDGSESILTKSQETGIAYYQREWNHQVHHHVGEMVNFVGKSINLRVTPNHSMWMAKQKGKMKFVVAGSVRGKTTEYYFEKKVQWECEGLERVTIPSYTHVQGAGMRTHKPKVIPIDVWLEFMGYFLTEGNVIWRKSQKHVCLTQTLFPDVFREAAKRMADCMECNLIEYPHNGGVRFILSNAQLASYLKDFTQPKRIPRELLMGLSAEQCRKFIDYLYAGDGCVDRRAKANENGVDYGRIYPGNEKEFSDDLQELYLKAGYGASETVSGKQYVASFMSNDRACLKFNNPPTFESGCDEMVYCVSLPKDHLLMVRRGGRSVWCGNSGYFYDKYGNAITFEEAKAGKPGTIKVFAAWYEFQDSRRDPAREEIFDESDLTAQERELAEEYKLDLWQVAWMRWAIREECNRDFEKFQEDYPFDEVTAFLKSGRGKFSNAALKRQEKRAEVAGWKYGEFTRRGDGSVAWTETGYEQAMWAMQEPPRERLSYLLACDPATGDSQTSGIDPDSHGAGVLRAGYRDYDGQWVEPTIACRNCMHEDGDTMACRWDTDVLAEQIHMASEYYGDCVIVPEMNKDNGLVELLKLKSANIYQRTEINRRTDEKTKYYGWKTAVENRGMIIDKFAAAIRESGNGDIGTGFDVRCPWTVKEMRSFVIWANGRAAAASGKHDDQVMMLCIGYHLLDHATPYFVPIRSFFVPPEVRRYERDQGDDGGGCFSV